MGEYFRTDENGNVEQYTFLLCHRNYQAIGFLNPISNNEFDDVFGAERKITFDFYKSGNEDIYEKLQDLSIIYIPEKNTYYEITVTENEDEKGIYKNISGIDNGTAELSQKILRDIEINTDSDIAREDYFPSLVYDITSQKTIENSILVRILKDKAPEYTIKHVDSTIANLQRSFSINSTSIIDWLRGDFAKELDCIVEVDSVDRSISVYDLLTTCNDCGYRGEDFDNGCPHCGGHNLIKGYGKNTNIVISIDNLADNIKIEANKDSIKNCFYVTGGDDVITNIVAACNPNGTNYFYGNSPEMFADMPKELSDKIRSYDELYKKKTPEYTDIITHIFNLLDEIGKIRYGEVDTPSSTDSTCEEQLQKILNGGISPISVQSLSYASLTTINNSIKTYAKIYLDSGFSVNILNGEYDSETHIWNGKLRVSKVSDNEIYCDSDVLNVVVDDNYVRFLEQKIDKTLAQYDLQNADVEPDWSTFCLSILSSYESAYQSCLDVLIQQGCADKTNACYNVYYKYYERHLHITQQVNILEGEISVLQDELDGYYKQQSAIQEELNFKNYVGDELYKVWSSYRREDEYSNSNFISTGLNNNELIAHTKELIEKASNELYKASIPQYTISSSVKNFLLMKEFENIKNYCELGNWIYVQTSNDVYKLRIIEIETNMEDLSEINLTFSNVSKIRNGSSDVESILNNSKTMATSYDSVKKQASVGQSAGDSINSWLVEGLDSSLYAIKNNNNEEITIDQSGLTGKSYDDVTESYSDEQVKVTHNVIAFTNNNWESVETAVGKSTYHRYNDTGYADGFPMYEGYGVNAKFLTAGYVSSSDIIGGNIYSYKPNDSSNGYNYSKYNKTGTHIDLVNSEFEFYGSGNGSSMLFQHDESGKSNLQILNGNVIAGHIYSTDYLTVPKDNDGLPLSPVMTDINLDSGSFSFAEGKLKYNSDKPNYMVVSEGGFQVEDSNGNVKGIFDQKGIDLHSGTYTHIGNFTVGTEGLTLDLGYDFVNRTSTLDTDFNVMQFLYSSDTIGNNASIRMRTPKALLTESNEERIQTESYFNGLTIQKIVFNEAKKVYEPKSEYPEVDININGINLSNKTILNSNGLYTGNTTIDMDGITTEKMLISSSDPNIFRVENGNGTGLINVTQSSVETSVDWHWVGGSVYTNNLYADRIFNNNKNSQIVISDGEARFLDSSGNLLPFYASNIGGGSGSGMNYSTEERVVGTWIDGQPVYQKTIYYEGSIGTDTVFFNTGIIYDEIKTIIQYYGMLYDTLNKAYIPLPYVYILNTTGQIEITMREVNHYLHIELLVDRVSYPKNRLKNVCLTLQYVKHVNDGIIYRKGVVYLGDEFQRTYTYGFKAEYDFTSYDYLYFRNNQNANTDAIYGCKNQFFLEGKYKYCIFKLNVPVLSTGWSNHPASMGLTLAQGKSETGNCGMTDGTYYYAVRRFADDVLDTYITFDWYMWWPYSGYHDEIRIYEIYLTDEPPTGMEIYEQVS